MIGGQSCPLAVFESLSLLDVPFVAKEKKGHKQNVQPLSGDNQLRDKRYVHLVIIIM